jgi:hypothetical protein
MNYHPFFCEENIWHLAQKLNRKDAYVYFIFHPQMLVEYHFQKTNFDPKLPVYWDYHVLYGARLKSGLQIWDFDTRLPCPCSAKLYFNLSFNLEKESVDPDLLIRVIPADWYVEHFFSDRKHMQQQGVESSNSPPPWPPILKGQIKLSDILDSRNLSIGELLELKQFLKQR